MDKFVKFSDWEKNKFSVKEKDVDQQPEENSSAQLLAELDDLTSQRKKALQRKDGYEAQILEISVKLKKLEIEKNDLLKKQKDLSEAREIAKKKNLEGRTNEQQ